MKKVLSLFIFMIMFASASFAAFSNYSTWQQAAPGVYIKDLNVSGSYISISYKYTSQFPGFSQMFSSMSKKFNKPVDSMLVDVKVNCSSNTVNYSPIKIVDSSGNVIYSAPYPQNPSTDRSVLNMCNAIKR